MKNAHLFTLSIISGLLLVCAWPMSPLTPLIFVGWIPLLIVADHEKIRARFFAFALITLVIWNAGTTWWIWNSTAAGAIGAIFANALLMFFPWWGYHIFKNKFGHRAGYFSLVVFWLSFEYIHLNWQLSWPWLTIGNVFASHPEWVQWYEYTGTSGGSLWVMTVNVMLYHILKTVRTENKKVPGSYWAGLAALVFVPLVVSLSIFHRHRPISSASNAPNVIIVQPNIDPYNEKFAEGSTEDQVQKLIRLSEEKIDTNTRLVLWPETALPLPVWQNQLQQNVTYQPVFDFVARHPLVTLQTGIETWKNYGTEKGSKTARKLEDGTYFDAFNASVAITKNQPFQFYNKSKLVPGVETLPDFLLWMGAIFEKFGGTTGGYGRDKEASVFTTNSPYKTAPIICYESIYGEYVASYVKKGANLLTIMTNDGWWANTPGHRQHLQYARLRAVETRRWVARSANTGISAVIDDFGDLVGTRQWAETGFIKFAIPYHNGNTFYVDHGDVISTVALILLCVLLLFYAVQYYKSRKSKNYGK